MFKSSSSRSFKALLILEKIFLILDFNSSFFLSIFSNNSFNSLIELSHLRKNQPQKIYI